MQRKQPSLTSHNHPMIQRRSSALSPDLNSPRILHSPIQNRYHGVMGGSGDQAIIQPTILLVPPALESAAVSYYDSTPVHASPRWRSSLADYETESDQERLSAIPLTPRPEMPERREESMESVETVTSQGPRIPTPEHGARNDERTLRGYLSRGLSLISAHDTQKSAPIPPHFVTMSARRDSTSSRTSTRSSGTCASVDSGHLSLIPSIGTTDKFTHRWPKPRSVKNMEMRTEGSGLSDVAVALEEGEGLGMNKVERWTTHKWCLVLSLITVMACGAIGLAYAVLTWFRAWAQADVMYVADNDILVLITLASSILLFTSLVGITGMLLNSRPILAIYALLLWPGFISVMAIGYIAYKRTAFSLDHKLNLAWSQYYTPVGRLLIQDSLRCCGFYNALHEATQSKRCYPRTPLPGCKGKLYRFEQDNLSAIWTTIFSVAPLHIVNMMTALLCANHITRRFGKGITPKRYRLSGGDVRENAANILRGIGGGHVVSRPAVSRASSSGTFREDRKARLPMR